jgi:hypothetical protein
VAWYIHFSHAQPSCFDQCHLTDHAPFISPKFNVNAYANAILAGEPYDPEAQIPAPPVQSEGNASSSNDLAEGNDGTIASGSLNVKGDVGLALAKLNYGIVSLYCGVVWL